MFFVTYFRPDLYASAILFRPISCSIIQRADVVYTDTASNNLITTKF